MQYLSPVSFYSVMYLLPLLHWIANHGTGHRRRIGLPFSYRLPPVEAPRDFMAKIDLHARWRHSRFQPGSSISWAHLSVNAQCSHLKLSPCYTTKRHNFAIVATNTCLQLGKIIDQNYSTIWNLDYQTKSRDIIHSIFKKSSKGCH